MFEQKYSLIPSITGNTDENFTIKSKIKSIKANKI